MMLLLKKSPLLSTNENKFQNDIFFFSFELRKETMIKDLMFIHENSKLKLSNETDFVTYKTDIQMHKEEIDFQ